MGILDGKIAVITGSSRGFGLAMAREFISQGASVVICSRSKSSVQAAVESLRSERGKAAGIACDVADPESVRALAEFAKHTFGGFDIWINNAALSAPYGPAVEIDPETYTGVLKANIFGAYYGSITALRHFLPLHRGKLINILGRGDRDPAPMQTAYGSSKAWLLRFTQALAKEHKNSGVGIFAFNPGMMSTELLQDIEVVSGHEESVKPLGTVINILATPPEVPARRAAWLASSATDRRSGLVVRQLTPGKLLASALREAGLRLTGRARPPADVRVTSAPSAFPAHPEER